MALDIKATIPGLPDEAQRALRDVQQSVARECKRIEDAARSPRRRCTEVIESGSVLARPGEVVRVLPGDEDVTVVLPEPSAASDGQDIIVSFEGDGTATGRVIVLPASGTCLAPGTQTLNAPGSYRFTSTGGGATPKPRSSSVPVDTSVPGGSGWAGPPPVTVDDLPPIGPDELDGSVAGDGLTGGGGTPLTVGAGDGIDVGADSVSADVSDFAGTGLEDDGSNNLRIAASAAGDGLIGGGGSPLAVGAGTGITVTADAVSVTTPLTDGDKGDITVSSSGTVWTIDNDVVSDAKLRNSAALSVIGRASNSAGDPADIIAIGGLQFLQTNAAATVVGWGTLTLAAFPAQASDTVLGNISGSTAVPSAVALTDLDSTSIVYDATSHTFQRAALTGAITASQNGNGTLFDTNASGAGLTGGGTAVLAVGAGTGITVNANDVAVTIPLTDGDKGDITVATSGTVWTIDNDVVSDAKLRNSAALSVIGRASNTSGDPADIAGTASSDAVLRISGTTLGFGQVATAGIANDAVTNEKLRNSSALSVIGRASNTSGDPADIIASGGLQFLQTNAAATVVGWGTLTLAAFPAQASDTVLGNISGSTAVPSAVALTDLDSTSIVYDATSHTFQRAALTGDVTASQNANATTIANDAVTNPKLADMAAGTVKGRQIDAGSGDPADLSGLEVAELIRFGSSQNETIAATTNDLTLGADTTVLRVTPTGAQTLTGITGGAAGRLLFIENIAADGNPLTLASLDAGSLTANRIRTPRGVALVLGFRESALLRWSSNNNDWRVVAQARATAIADGDYGDITVSANGLTWNIDAGVVTETELSASVAGAGLTGGAGTALAVGAGTGITVAADAVSVTIPLTDGDKGDITVSSSGTVWELDAGVVGPTELATTVAGAGLTGGGGSALAVGAGTNVTVTADAVSVDDYPLSGLADQAADTVVANVTAGSAAPTAHSLSTLAGGGLTYAAGVMAVGAGTGITVAADAVSVTIPLTDGDKGDITVASSGTSWTVDNDAITDGKLRNSAAVSVIGRSANSSGDPADIAAGANDRVLARASDSLSFQQVSTGMVADAAVTLAKLENRAAGTVIGRTIDGGSGTPVALSGLEVGELLRMGTAQSVTLAAQVDNQTLNDDTTVLRLTPTGAQTITGMTGGASGRVVFIENVAGSGNNLTIASLSASSLTANRFRTPNGVDLVLRFRESAIARWDAANGDWRIVATARSTAVADADYGDITVSSGGSAWAIDNDVVSDAKLRNSGALSVIGRASNTSGDPADISATVGGQVLRLNDGGTALSFSQVSTAGIAGNAVDNTVLANMAQSTIKGRAESAGTGDPQDLTPAQVVAIIDGEDATWTGVHTFTGTNLLSAVSGDVRLGATSGIGLFAGHTTSNVTDGDLVANASSGLALHAGATPVTSVSAGRVALTADTDITATAPDVTISSSGSGTTTLTGGANTVITAGTQITLGSPTALGNALSLTGAISPTISSDQNNWSPTGIGGASVIRVTASGANRTITGIAGGTGGRLLILINVGTNLVIVDDESASSSAANRIVHNLDAPQLAENEVFVLWYDNTSSRWRIIAFMGSINP